MFCILVTTITRTQKNHKKWKNEFHQRLPHVKSIPDLIYGRVDQGKKMKIYAVCSREQYQSCVVTFFIISAQLTSTQLRREEVVCQVAFLQINLDVILFFSFSVMYAYVDVCSGKN